MTSANIQAWKMALAAAAAATTITITVLGECQYLMTPRVHVSRCTTDRRYTTAICDLVRTRSGSPVLYLISSMGVVVLLDLHSCYSLST